MTDLSGILLRARWRLLLVIALLVFGACTSASSAKAQELGAAAPPTKEAQGVGLPDVEAGGSTLPNIAPAVQASTPAVRPQRAGILPGNLSPWGMFMSADVVVKAVMVGLAFASILTWTVWLAKSLELLAALRTNRRLLAQVARAPSLDAAADVT
jgi:biopolymer transport protein ExbB